MGPYLQILLTIILANSVFHPVNGMGRSLINFKGRIAKLYDVLICTNVTRGDQKVRGKVLLKSYCFYRLQ